uniref:Pentacotripeptide-repeat region of PRORP domain-containing protein n=1 Tax=Solanum lycopersicum TaxID=4081 RepID=K4CU11_SOLLC
MRSSTPDEDILVTLVRGLGHARIIKVVSKFEKKSILKQYDSILDVLVNEDNDINGKVGRARSLMRELVEPSDATFNILISAYCGEGNLVQALVMLENSFRKGYIPDVIAVPKVVELLCNNGRVSEALEVLEKVEERGGIVDVVAYNTLINGFCRLGKVKVGCRLLKETELKGCMPNVDTYNGLISSLCDSQDLDSALEMFNEMKRRGVGINWNFVTYDTLIHGLCWGGRVENGLKILEVMKDDK